MRDAGWTLKLRAFLLNVGIADNLVELVGLELLLPRARYGSRVHLLVFADVVDGSLVRLDQTGRSCTMRSTHNLIVQMLMLHESALGCSHC